MDITFSEIYQTGIGALIDGLQATSTDPLVIQQISEAKRYILDAAMYISARTDEIIYGLANLSEQDTFDVILNEITLLDTVILNPRVRIQISTVMALKEHIIDTYFSLFTQPQDILVNGVPLSEIQVNLRTLRNNSRGGRSKKSKRRAKMTRRRKYKR